MSFLLKKHPWLGWLALVVLATGCSIAIAWAHKNNTVLATAATSPPQQPAQLHPVVIKPGPAVPRLDTGLKDAAGNALMATCSTCHNTTTPNKKRNTAHDLFQAHRGLNYEHGGLTCLSCHNAANYDTLHLADGDDIPFPEVMRLCGQCHGTQKRDYDHGSHGGMNGHWDRAKGGRIRNNCVNCHDPHHPAFPLVQPVFHPRDRISVPPSTDHHQPGAHD